MKTIKDLKTRALKTKNEKQETKDYKNNDIKKFLTNHFKGQAGSAVFWSFVLLAKSNVNQNWLQQIPACP